MSSFEHNFQLSLWICLHISSKWCILVHFKAFNHLICELHQSTYLHLKKNKVFVQSPKINTMSHLNILVIIETLFIISQTIYIHVTTDTSEVKASLMWHCVDGHLVVCGYSFMWRIAGSFPLFMTIAWIFTASMIVKGIVYEKEQRLKEVMKVMGLSNASHWLAWFITCFIMMFLSVLLLLCVLKVSTCDVSRWHTISCSRHLWHGGSSVQSAVSFSFKLFVTLVLILLC